MKLLKKLVVFLLLFSILLFSSSGLIFAQSSPTVTPVPVPAPTPGGTGSSGSGSSGSTGGSSFQPASVGAWYNQDFPSWYSKVYNSKEQEEIFGERYTAAQVQWILYSLAALIMNGMTGPAGECIFLEQNAVDCLEPLNPLFENDYDAYNQNSNESLASVVFAERPISLVTYIKDVGRRIHLVPEVYAQQTGFGFNALGPILSLWRAARNMVYSLFVIVILVLAFMIMFRVKISPQVSISVQSALPRVVIALILVTFSYAIAGLLIDLMYVVYGFISLAFAGEGLLKHIGVRTTLNAVQIFKLMTVGPQFFGVRLGIFGFLFRYYMGLVMTSGSIIMSSDSAFIKAGMTIFGLLALVAFWLIALWIGMKIIWLLLKTLAQVFLLTVVAPFQILLGVIQPKIGFGAWLRTYTANLAVFPTVSLMLVLATMFLRLAFVNSFANLDLGSFLGFFPFVGFAEEGIQQGLTGNAPAQAGAWPPLLFMGDNTVGLIFMGVSFVIITVVPKTANLIKAMIESRPFDLKSAIGEAFGPAWLQAEAKRTGEEALGYGVGTYAQGTSPSTRAGQILKDAVETIAKRRKYIQ